MAESERSENHGQVAPYALAMVICDALYVDPTTAKKTLLGLFTSIFSEVYPVRIPHLCVYVALTDGHGKTPIKLRLIDVNESRPPIFEGEMEFDFSDPRIVLEHALMMGNVEIPEAGEYRMQLFACNDPLMERRIIVVNPNELPSEDAQ